MKKLVRILAITVSCVGVFTSLFAQEKGGSSFTVAVSRGAKDRLCSAKTIAVFLSGNDLLLTRILEDALAIHLTNAGFTPINREILDKSVGEQVARKKREKGEGTINALEIGIAVNADHIVTGTVVVESLEQRSLLTKVASFQLVDVANGRTLISVLFESEKGSSLSEIAKAFTDILRQNME